MCISMDVHTSSDTRVLVCTSVVSQLSSLLEKDDVDLMYFYPTTTILFMTFKT